MGVNASHQTDFYGVYWVGVVRRAKGWILEEFPMGKWDLTGTARILFDLLVSAEGDIRAD